MQLLLMVLLLIYICTRLPKLVNSSLQTVNIFRKIDRLSEIMWTWMSLKCIE